MIVILWDDVIYSIKETLEIYSKQIQDYLPQNNDQRYKNLLFQINSTLREYYEKFEKIKYNIKDDSDEVKNDKIDNSGKFEESHQDLLNLQV